LPPLRSCSVASVGDGRGPTSSKHPRQPTHRTSTRSLPMPIEQSHDEVAKFRLRSDPWGRNALDHHGRHRGCGGSGRFSTQQDRRWPRRKCITDPGHLHRRHQRRRAGCGCDQHLVRQSRRDRTGAGTDTTHLASTTRDLRCHSVWHVPPEDGETRGDLGLRTLRWGARQPALTGPVGR